ncbi:MAG: hypothetical protein HY270_09275 [Deltaproteobacteria bacterium]|nr:hypothetical protein [Deltaproteobacteria bacterium]
MMRLGLSLFAIAVSLIGGNVAGAQNKPALPSYFSVPERMIISHPERIVVENDASASFRVEDGAPRRVERHGKRFVAYLMMDPDLEQEPREIWVRAKVGLIKSGWKIVGEQAGPPVVATLHRKVGSKDVWATFTVRSSAESSIEIIESNAAAKP